ncbi:uncharacterized protein LOC141715975 [Apium graveolens]|uniref:uncharacterized protein LOC141715975 n=1 Tax=Apium graveolens TaxID=4045 RepID=UPI003D7BFDEC
MTIEEAVGSLKAHEERLQGKTEVGGEQFLLTEEEWRKREKNEGHLLLTREEWLKKTSKGDVVSGIKNSGAGASRDGGRSVRDRSEIKYFNCNIYGHYAAECRRPKRERRRDVKTEAHLTQAQGDDEPALLLVEHKVKERNQLLLNEQDTVPKLSHNSEKRIDSNVWYLDNGTSNHISGFRSKFKTLDDGVTGLVRFGDGSTVSIKGKGTIGFQCKNGEELTFHDVYFIPDLCNNIISLGQLSENGNKVILKEDYLWIYDGQERLVMKVQRSAN